LLQKEKSSFELHLSETADLLRFDDLKHLESEFKLENNHNKNNKKKKLLAS
jgi:hypothetical protein